MQGALFVAKLFVPVMMSIRLTRLHVASTMSRAFSSLAPARPSVRSSEDPHVHVFELPLLRVFTVNREKQEHSNNVRTKNHRNKKHLPFQNVEGENQRETSDLHKRTCCIHDEPSILVPGMCTAVSAYKLTLTRPRL